MLSVRVMYRPPRAAMPLGVVVGFEAMPLKASGSIISLMSTTA
jgi:hypothetical protein